MCNDYQMKRLLSIDVGIKNLAFCIFDVTESAYTIVSWDVFNLCGTPPVCNQQTSKGICKRMAKYQKGSIKCCKTCAKKTNLIIPSEKLLKANQTRTNVSDLKSIAEDYGVCIPKNAKKKDIQDRITHFMEVSALEAVPKTSASDLSLVDIGIAIRNSFDTSLFLSIDTVIIENQISPIANRMKTIQGMIAQFFIMRQIEDVHFVSAANKLKPFIQGKTTYKERKALGITTTRNIIHENEEHILWREHFSKHTKKDDLADSFLQGLWYIDKNIHNIHPS